MATNKPKNRLGRRIPSRSGEFAVTGEFNHGYRNKEDVSNLPANVLVVGSQNVLTNASEQVVIRNGYSLDGDAGNQNTYGIDSAFDFDTHLNGIRNLRKWGTTLETRYENPVSSAVSWVTLLSTLSATNVVNFATFFDSTEIKNLLLFVNGNNNVYEWSGGVGSYLSSTTNTITLSGTTSLGNLNFYTATSGKMKLLIDGVTYSYTAAGVSSATAFTQTPTNNNIAMSPSQWNSQLFTTGATATQILSAGVRVNSAAGGTVSANFVGLIYTDNAGVPGTLVASTTTSIPAVYSSGNFDITFTFTNVSVSAATNYHFVIYCTQGTITVYTGNVGGTGTNISTNTGSTWSAQNGYMYLTVTENDVSTTTFVGVTPDPTGAGIVVGDAVVQLPIIGTSAVTSCTLTEFDLIANFGNQIYYGSFIDHNIFVTKVNSYTDATVSVPRVVGQGATAVLDAPPVAFIAQDDSMLCSAGKEYWYQSIFTLSADLAKEAFEFHRLKTTSNQGTQSQALTNKMKNNVIYVSFEPIFNTLGTVQNFLNSPQAINLSDPIKYDIDAYDFTGGGSVYYFNYYLYFTVPAMGVVRMYNVEKKYWEAPQVMPISFFYQVDGVLYGHSSLTNESYQVFVPSLYNDNNNPINAIAAFPYNSLQGGSAPEKKNFNQYYTEGYIATNTAITLTINYDFGGFSGNYSVQISGADSQIIFNKVTDGSLGQNTLGSQPLGTILNITPQPPIPKFRVINTFPRKSVYEYQVVYSSNEIDQNWALLRFGPAINSANVIPVEIKE
jgi:hypothetical protein